MNPIATIVSAAAAILVRRRWLSLAAAVGVGVAVGLVGPLRDFFEAFFTARGFESVSWAEILPAAMSAPASLVWWCVVRWFDGLRRRRRRHPQASPSTAP